MNFGLEEHVEHATRHRRAREFFDVADGCGISWADDAFIFNVESGEYFDSGETRRPQSDGGVRKCAGLLTCVQFRAGRLSCKRERPTQAANPRCRDRRSYFCCGRHDCHGAVLSMLT